MRIYVSHSSSFDFQSQLYQPLSESALAGEHVLIFPHRQSNEPFPIRELLAKRQCDLVVAEVSYPSTGQGIELAWAAQYGVPILCVSRIDTKRSSSLEALKPTFIEYRDGRNLIEIVKDFIEHSS